MNIIFDYYNTLYNPKSGKLFRGTRPLLNKLSRNNNLILISTGSQSRWREIESQKLLPIFTQIIICKIKTKALFSTFIQSNSLIIGDRRESEINLGKKLNSSTLLVNPNKENPILTINKYFKYE